MYRLLNLRRKLHANFLCLKKHSKLCCRTKYFWAADVFFLRRFSTCPRKTSHKTILREICRYASLIINVLQTRWLAR